MKEDNFVEEALAAAQGLWFRDWPKYIDQLYRSKDLGLWISMGNLQTDVVDTRQDVINANSSVPND